MVWPTVRGLYLSANTPEALSDAWSRAFKEAMAAPGYGQLLSQYGLYPLPMTGPALQAYVDQQLLQYGALATELGLRRWAR